MWDARAAVNASVYDLSETLVREHLRAAGSALVEEPDARTIYREMDIVRRVNDREVPRNVGLLFFSREPERWFPGARIETCILRAGGDVLEDVDSPYEGKRLSTEEQQSLATITPTSSASRSTSRPSRSL